MELWIRTSDKLCLTKVHHLYVDDRNNIMQENDLILATYKTKERALEVLDEIQRILHPTVFMSGEISTDDNSWIENGIMYQECKDNFSIYELPTYVYQMPEE